jgi:4-hydroxy-2-oxoheptanedioate aldolase
MKPFNKDSPLLGGVLAIPNPHVAELYATAGFDYLIIDLQHGLHDYRSMATCVQILNMTKVLSVVRVVPNDFDTIGRALDAGANGVIAAMLEDAAGARSVACSAKYPPLGGRSFGPLRSHAYAGSDYLGFANETTLCAGLIETARGVDNVSTILGTPGIDGVYVGVTDLKISLGMSIAGEASEQRPDVLNGMYSQIVSEARRVGKVAGIHCGNTAEATHFLELGFNLISISTDLEVLSGNLKSQAAAFRSLVKAR